MMKPLLSVRERLSAAALVAAMGCAGMAQAQTIDGTRDASYPAALAVQVNATSFGDSNTGSQSKGNGDELDNVHARIVGTDLYLFIGGNLTDGFNKLEMFFDTQAGGQNVLRNDNPNVDSNGLNKMAGLTFDSGFASDYYLMATTGDNQIYINVAETPTGGGGQGKYSGGGTGRTHTVNFNPLTGATTDGDVSFDNSNVAGVTGSQGTTTVAAATAVSTGLEMRIPLAAFNLTPGSGDIKLCLFINGQGHDYVSSQILAPFPAGTGSLGGDGNGNYIGGITPLSGINFNNFAGNQYVTITNPAPVAPALSVSANALSFYNVGVGSSATRTFTVTNTGSGTLNVSGITSNNPAFTVSPATASLAAGASATITATFAPTAPGASAGAQLSIASNATNATVALSGTGIAAGQVVIDGTADAGLYTQKAVQTSPTQFGNNLSELDAAYVRMTSTDLYVTIAGNLEGNSNRLLLFFDADPNAGQPTLLSNNPTADFGASGKLAGITFDQGFAPESFIGLSQNGTSLYANYVPLNNAGGSSTYLSAGSQAFTQPLDFGSGVMGELSFNNSNTAGVTDTDVAGAGAVTTGLELRIPLSALGSGISSTTPIHVMALLVNGAYDYLSNQTLGGLIGVNTNLGSDGTGVFQPSGTTVNFHTFPGNQFFTAQRGDLTVSNSRTIAGDYRNVTVTNGGQLQMQNPFDVSGALTVQTGGSFAPGCGIPVTGSGSFSLAAGSILLAICDPAGLTASGNTGAIRVSGARSYSDDATYHFVGPADSTPQVTGNGLPARVRSLVVASNGPALGLSQALGIRRTLTLTQNLNTNGNALTLLSDANGTALIKNDGGVVNGTGTMQRAITGAVTGPAYRHFSAPVSNTTVGDLATPGFVPVLNTAYNSAAQPNQITPFPTVFGYDQGRIATVTSSYNAFDKGWFSPGSLADAMTPTRGYTVNAPATATPIDFVGTFNTGTQNSGTLSRGANADAGWQLLGNPYPSPLDWSTVGAAQRPGMDAAMYVYQPTGQYTGTYRTYANGVGDSPLIAAGAGYFARVSTAGGTGSVNLTNDNRVTAWGTQPAFGRGTADTRPQLQLSLQGAGLTDDLYVYAEAGATTGVDASYDAVKLPNTHGLNVAALAGTEALAINALPALTTATVVPLQVGVPAAGSYTFEAVALTNFNGTVYLRDAVTGRQYDLRQQPSYTFATTATALAGRFALVFAPAGAPLATAAELSAAHISVFPNPARQRFTVQVPTANTGTVGVTLYNSLGQQVRTVRAAATGEATSVAVDASGLAAGVYTLRVQAGSATPVAKRVVLE